MGPGRFSQIFHGIKFSKLKKYFGDNLKYIKKIKNRSLYISDDYLIRNDPRAIFHDCSMRNGIAGQK